MHAYTYLVYPHRKSSVRFTFGLVARYMTGHRSEATSQAKIPEGAKSFAMKSTKQGSNDGELLCIGALIT